MSASNFRSMGPLVALIAAHGLAGCRLQQAGREEFGTVGLTDLGGYFELETTRQTRSRSSNAGGVDTDSEEWLLAEKARLEVEGFAIHPNLIDFSAGALFGLLQSGFQISPDVNVDTGNGGIGQIVEFDLTANMLKEKDFPGLAFVGRAESLEARPFSTSLRRATSEQGLTWSYLDETFPSRVQLNHSTVRYDTLDSSEEPRVSIDDLARFETEWVMSKENKLGLEYELKQIEKQPFDLFFEVEDLELSHELVFGGEKQNRLDSRAVQYTQQGSTELDRSQLTERLNLELTKSLNSLFVVELLDRNQSFADATDGVHERSAYTSVTVDHQLYDNLHTQVGGYIQDQAFDGAMDLARDEVYIDFGYYRHNPWGRLTVDARFARSTNSRTGADPAIFIIDEPGTFNDPVPIVLGDPNVDLTTIVVTDLAGTTVYQEGLDYTVVVFGNAVELHRVPTGLIADGTSVLIDYQILAAEPYELATSSRFFGIRQDFDNGVSPYIRWRLQNQNFTSDPVAGLQVEEFRDVVLGCDYRLANWSCSAERTDHRSSIIPYSSLRFGTSYTHDFSIDARGSVGASWLELNYEDVDSREVQHFSLDFAYDQRVGRTTRFEGTLRFLDDRDSLNIDNRGVDLDLALEWTYRALEFRTALELGTFENDLVGNDVSRLYLQIRRSF